MVFSIFDSRAAACSQVVIPASYRFVVRFFGQASTQKCFGSALVVSATYYLSVFCSRDKRYVMDFQKTSQWQKSTVANVLTKTHERTWNMDSSCTAATMINYVQLSQCKFQYTTCRCSHPHLLFQCKVPGLCNQSLAGVSKNSDLSNSSQTSNSQDGAINLTGSFPPMGAQNTGDEEGLKGYTPRTVSPNASMLAPAGLVYMTGALLPV